jgi:hypothetical protein
VAAFCGDCHVLPSPDTFPRAGWAREVDRGFEFYRLSGRSDLDLPPRAMALDYFQTGAPAEIQLTKPVETNEAKIAFRRDELHLPDSEDNPSISYLEWPRREGKKVTSLGVCDMRFGAVMDLTFENRVSAVKPVWKALARLQNPAHVERGDFDRDGVEDYLVADLGTANPVDHQLGRVMWVRPSKQNGAYEAVELQTRLGRVADVRAADFDRDGDVDLVVAEFGYLSTGRILLLRQVGWAADRPLLEMEVLDERHGAIHVPTIDLDGDGDLDFVALVSQEFETVDAFLNKGNGTFESKRIFAAKDPSFGSSGIQLADMDRDGDVDVLLSNGDTLDSFFLKPYHGVQWLENRGGFPFTHHQLTLMPGVSRALACDLDGDSDLDVVAAAFVPYKSVENAPTELLSSLIWLEQLSPGNFLRRRLEASPTGHLALEVGDFDLDGDIDVAVGNSAPMLGDREPALTIWWNEGLAK